MTRKLAMVLLLGAALVPRPAAALETDELLALVAMPLAVAAVSEVTDVPMNELMNFVSLLNQADVPPMQFVEVIRYVPVALADTTFVEYVRTRQQSGLSGPTLVTIIEDRYRTVYGLGDIDFDIQPQQQIVYFDDGDMTDFIPTAVRSHPHGGPPGQLKKERGLQTGAEVVHGVTGDRAREAIAREARVRNDREVRAKKDREANDKRVTRGTVKRERKPAKIEHHRGGIERREVKVERSHAGGGNGKARGPSGNSGKGGGDKGKGKGNGGGKKGKG